jgi:hypothetical protein
MRNRIQPLLCEFHAHTTWSDGSLSVRELVDLYGGRGFDVLCISDHTVRSDDPWRTPSEWPARDVRREVHASYVAEILQEASRALPSTTCSSCLASSSPTTRSAPTTPPTRSRSA